MAYREHGMWEVLEVLRRAHRGERQRAISRTTGRSRKTIRRYLKIAGKLGWRPGQEEPDEPLAARVQARLRPGSPEVGPSESERLLQPQRDQEHGSFRLLISNIKSEPHFLLNVSGLGH